MHRPPCCFNQWCCMSKQGTVDNAKVPLSVPPPPTLLPTVVCTATMIVITQKSKEQPTMLPRCPLLLSRYRCCAPSTTLPPSTPSHKQARNSRRCQGTVIHAATTIVVVHHHLCRCHDCKCTRGQGTASNATMAPSSAPPPFFYDAAIVAHQKYNTR